MTKKIVSFIAFSVLALLMVFAVFACEKAIIPDDEENGVGDPDGNLRVTVYMIGKTPFEAFTRGAAVGSTRGSVSATESGLLRLNFAVYDKQGTRVKQVNQTSDNGSFGTASFQLEPGTYQLVVVGHSSNGNPTMTDLTKIKFTNAQGFTDTFLYYSAGVVVTEESQELPVSLGRIVSMCRFVMTDNYPADVAQMRFQYKGGSGAFDATTGLGSVNSTQTLYFDAAEGQKQFDLYTFLHDDEGTIHLQVTAYDADDNVLQEREFDVPMERDHITWLTGAFFSGSGSSSSTTITVTVNTDWSGETHLTF
jgi:hypothetical protein